MKTIAKGPFLGINNRLPDFALHKDKVGDFVRGAINVDLTNAGTFVRRKTASLLQALTAPHSLHNELMVIDSALYSVTLPTYSQTLVKLLSSNDRMSYVDFAGDTYFSNGMDAGRVSNGVAYPMGLPLPAEPVVTAIPGTLPAGWYQVAVSYYNSITGEEGGVSPSQNFHLTSDGALRITLPAATAGATHLNVYVSTVNGSVPFLHKTVATGTVTTDVTAISTASREANQRYEVPLPAGRLFLFNGCLCSYKDNVVYEGLPFRPGYYIPSEGGVRFPSAVSNCVPAQNGIYVVADKTYWIPGTRITTAEGIIQDVLPYGGVYGTEFAAPHKSQYGWFGDKGFVIASAQGEVEAVMTETVAVGTLPNEGFSTVFEDDGNRRVVSCGYTLNLENMGVTTYDGWDFTSISGDYATRSDGVYVFDNQTKAAWSINLGKQNFGAENLKHLPAVYVGHGSTEPVYLTTNLPNGAEYDYTARSVSEDLQIQRIDTGKGLRANWYGLSFSAREGEDFTLASVSFAPVASTRRI